MKACKTCNETKSLDSFPLAKGCVDGRRGECKSCRAYKEKESWKENSHRPSRTPEYRRRERLGRLYGITLEDYDVLLKIQSGVCAICKEERSWNRRDDGTLVVDHDHVTGKVRGLLCHACNQSLGLMRDNVDTLLMAVSYLKENGV